MRWIYEIVGSHRRLAGGSFEALHLEAAKRYVQTVSDPTVTAEAELDVRILTPIIQCAPTARNTSGGRFHPESCR
jgi:hypothetical protein